jgi:hypothetical protein
VAPAGPYDLLGEDYSLVEKNALYRCLDKLLAHKQAFEGFARNTLDEAKASFRAGATRTGSS